MADTEITGRIAQFLIFFPVFLFSLSFHESAHAWMADRLGDSTARLSGRLTLNPLAHIDWIGTVLFPLMMFVFPGFLMFGWAKPVPVNPLKLKGWRIGNLKVAAAGPISNVILALFFAGVLRGLAHLEVSGMMISIGSIVYQMLETGVILNLSLALFNLIPIPPLDGSHILEGLLPPQALQKFQMIERYGFLIMLAGLYLGIFRYLSIPIYAIATLLLPK